MAAMRTRSLAELGQIKGSDRIQINNILSAICIGALSVLLGLSPERLSPWAIGQLAVAVPCLVTSSLAYAKTCYRSNDEYFVWDTLGWLTHSLGYSMILNALAILLHRASFVALAWLLIAVSASLFILYSVLDVRAKRRRLREKGLKLLFYLALLLGAALPILAYWT